MSSLLFGEIYEAIRVERVKKGVYEKEILDRIQQQFGGCLNVANAVEEIQAKKGPTMTPVSDFVRIYKKNLEDPQKDKFVLKTIQTLKKLAEDGVLVKTGKRYLYEAKCLDEDEEDEEEDDEDDDEEEQKNNKRNDEGEEEEPEEEEEEGDDDNDEGPCCNNKQKKENKEESGEDNDEEDDDNDDDDNCKGDENGEKEQKDTVHMQRGKEGLKEKNYFQCKSLDKMTIKNKHSGECMEKRNENGTPSKIVDTNTEKVVREGEAFAFCVRDFIDSLYRSRSGSKLDEELTQGEDELVESMDAEEIIIGKNLKNRKRKFSSIRNKSRSKYRSRSPLKKNTPGNAFTGLKSDGFETLCYRISSQFSQEPMDADLETMENDKDIEIEYESFRRRSPLGTLPSGSTEDVERRKSIIEVEEQKKPSEVFPESDKIFTAKEASPTMITAFEVDEIQSRTYNVDGEENDSKTKETYLEDDVTVNDDDDDKTSFCSECHKAV